MRALLFFSQMRHEAWECEITPGFPPHRKIRLLYRGSLREARRVQRSYNKQGAAQYAQAYQGRR